MSVISLIAAFLGGVALGWVAMAAARRRRKPDEESLVAFADNLDAVERLWKPNGVTVGYSIDYATGDADVTIRVANVGVDVVFGVSKQRVRHERRPTSEVLGLTEELPPSLRRDKR
jgi:hypothetical protein